MLLFNNKFRIKRKKIKKTKREERIIIDIRKTNLIPQAIVLNSKALSMKRICLKIIKRSSKFKQKKTNTPKILILITQNRMQRR